MCVFELWYNVYFVLKNFINILSHRTKINFIITCNTFFTLSFCCAVLYCIYSELIMYIFLISGSML